MPNHVQAVVVPERVDLMAMGFGRAHSAYSRYFNSVRRRSGHLSHERFYSALWAVEAKDEAQLLAG